MQMHKMESEIASRKKKGRSVEERGRRRETNLLDVVLRSRIVLFPVCSELLGNLFKDAREKQVQDKDKGGREMRGERREGTDRRNERVVGVGFREKIVDAHQN